MGRLATIKTKLIYSSHELTLNEILQNIVSCQRIEQQAERIKDRV